MAKLTPNVDTRNASVNAEGSGWRKYTPFAADVPRQAIGTALVDESAAGNQSQFDRVGYNSLAEQAAAAGRGVGTQQQSLADALLARSQGRGGPSLAEMQLKQSLEGQRKSAADALAGVRGMNPAAAQRLLLSQQANLGQQAAGQGAILRAQEQLAAQTALGNQLGAMRGAEQASFAGAGQLGLGQEKLSVEAQEAQRSREMEIALANQRAEQVRQQLQQTQENQAYETAAASRANAGNAVNQLIASFAAHGGIIKKYAEGGKVNPSKGIADKAKEKMRAKLEQVFADAAAEKSKEEGGKVQTYKSGDTTHAVGRGNAPTPYVAEGYYNKASWRNAMDEMTDGALDSNATEAERDLKAFQIKQLERQKEAYEKEKYEKTKRMANGGPVNAAMGRLTKMDNEKNDVVPAMLSPGEIVIPRSIVSAPNAPVAAAKFVEALLANKGKKDAKMVALKAALGKK